ncbi:MAG: 5'-methylthioadenosine/adenosylhomocysteine nucleosidase [Acutalibacter sp.]|jgi:adenosylhomocysteine nucleosidase
MSENCVGLIGAMKMEVDAILQSMEDKSPRTYGGMTFTQGVLAGVPVVVAQCSPGKVNAALCAQAMIDLYHPKLVLNLGVAGGIGEGVHIGDVVIATACVEYDFDTSALDGWPAGQMTLPGEEDHPLRFLPCDQTLAHVLARASEDLYGHAHLGIVATGDRFVADPQFGDYLQKEFDALACEMEGGAIAHVCLANKVPCAVLRTISDNAHDSETVDFLTFAQDSAAKAQKLLQAVLPQL